MSYEHVFIDKLILAGMLLISIREVPSSNIGQETDFPDRGVSWFPSVPTPFLPVRYWGRTSNLGSAPTFHSLFPIHFTVRLFIATDELLNHKKHIHPALDLCLFVFNPLVSLHLFLISAVTFSV